MPERKFIKYSFICNTCEYISRPPIDGLAEKNREKCEKCNGRGSEWQPKDKEAYENDPLKYMAQIRYSR